VTQTYSHPMEIPRSTTLTGLRWTGERSPCPATGIHGDTYPMSWAADGHTYMSAGDPNFATIDGQTRHVPWPEAFDKPDLYPHMGGLDVERLTGHGADFGIEQINTMPGLMGPGGNGPKPSGMISVQGTLYLAAQNLLGKKPAAHREKSQHSSDATILRSDDFGRTWYPDIQTGLTEMEAQLYDRRNWRWRTPPEARTSWRGWKPMFPGASFGGPTFIQYGQDHADAVDGYVYAISGDQWDNGSELRLGRGPQDRILEIEAWEWATVQPDSSVTWIDSLAASKPVLTLDGHLGLPEMIYLKPIERYLLLTWGLHKDFHVDEGSELTILESEHPWGPFRLVYYEELWESVEVCPYCPRVPLQWFDAERLSGWLLYSGSWHTVEHYRPHVKPFELVVA
jgi:hypothetical protein